jgi:hypothetical protein
VIVDILLAELRSSSSVIEIVTEVVETESGGTMIVGVTVVEVFLAATASNSIQQNTLKIKMEISIIPTTSDDAMGEIASVKNAPDKNALDNKTKVMMRTTANYHRRRLCRTGLRQENSKSMWLKGFRFLSRGQSSGR